MRANLRGTRHVMQLLRKRSAASKELTVVPLLLELSLLKMHDISSQIKCGYLVANQSNGSYTGTYKKHPAIKVAVITIPANMRLVCS